MWDRDRLVFTMLGYVADNLTYYKGEGKLERSCHFYWQLLLAYNKDFCQQSIVFSHGLSLYCFLYFISVWRVFIYNQIYNELNGKCVKSQINLCCGICPYWRGRDAVILALIDFGLEVLIKLSKGSN